MPVIPGLDLRECLEPYAHVKLINSLLASETGARFYLPEVRENADAGLTRYEYKYCGQSVFLYFLGFSIPQRSTLEEAYDICAVMAFSYGKESFYFKDAEFVKSELKCAHLFFSGDMLFFLDYGVKVEFIAEVEHLTLNPKTKPFKRLPNGF